MVRSTEVGFGIYLHRCSLSIQMNKSVLAELVSASLQLRYRYVLSNFVQIMTKSYSSVKAMSQRWNKMNVAITKKKLPKTAMANKITAPALDIV